MRQMLFKNAQMNVEVDLIMAQEGANGEWVVYMTKWTDDVSDGTERHVFRTFDEHRQALWSADSFMRGMAAMLEALGFVEF